MSQPFLPWSHVILHNAVDWVILSGAGCMTAECPTFARDLHGRKRWNDRPVGSTWGECTQINRFQTGKIQFNWKSTPSWPQKESWLGPDQALSQWTWERSSPGYWPSLVVEPRALFSLPSPGYPCGPSHIYNFPVSASQGNFILSFKWTLSCIRVRKLYPSLSSLCAERKPGNVMLWAKSGINAAAHEDHMKTDCCYPDRPCSARWGLR